MISGTEFENVCQCPMRGSFHCDGVLSDSWVVVVVWVMQMGDAKGV